MPELMHVQLARAEADSIAEREDVQAVLLTGSVARGEHCASSDVDLLVVGPETADLPVRRVAQGHLVERIAHSESGWMARFDRPRTSWLYAFCEAEILVDDGVGRRLQELAGRTRREYRASQELRQNVATMLWHSQAKLERARDGDDLSQGFWAAICIEYILNALYTVHDVALPAGSRLVAHLPEVPLTQWESERVRDLFTNSTAGRLQAATALTDDLLTRLGPADHE